MASVYPPSESASSVDISMPLEASPFLGIVISSGIASASALIAFFAYLIRRREPWANALLSIMDRLEQTEIREIRRKIVYNYPREHDGDWRAPDLNVDDTNAAINRWGAEMDLLALLYFSRQLDRVAFFEIYGDVVLRTAYKLAPYANRQREERGEQFWLPFQKLTLALLRLWNKRARKDKYPGTIGFPGSKERISPHELKNDHHLRRFLQANSLRLKL